MDWANAVDYLWKGLWVVLSFGVIIFIHELGHFIFSKLIGVKVERFSLGFLGKVVGFKRGETEYQISWLPLGGYVKLEGEFPEKDEDYQKLGPRAFIKRPWWQRVIVYFAGPFFNYLGAIVLSVFILLAGVKIFPLAVKVMPGSPAALAGLENEDKILTAGGREIWSIGQLNEELKNASEQNNDREVALTIERGQETLSLAVRPARKLVERYMIGVETSSYDLTVKVRLDWPAATAGLQDGDLILAVGEKKVGNINELSGEINAQAATGGEISLSVKRGGEELAFNLRPRRIEEENHTIGVEELKLPPVVGDTVIGLSAYQAGLRQGDRIISVNGVEMRSFEQLASFIHVRPKQELAFIVARQETRYPVTLIADEIDGAGRVGISPPFGEPRIKRFGLRQSLSGGVARVNFTVVQICRGLSSLFKGEQNLRRAIGGPVTILRMMGKEARSGWRELLNMVIMLNVMLAILNLLPIPVVDGGEITMAIAEGIRRRPLKVRTIMFLKQAGFIFILLLMVLATANDISRLFQGLFGSQMP